MRLPAEASAQAGIEALEAEAMQCIGEADPLRRSFSEAEGQGAAGGEPPQ